MIPAVEKGSIFTRLHASNRLPNREDANVDCGAFFGLRIDRKGSLHQFYSLLNSRQTKASAFSCCVGVEACSGIPNGEMNLIVGSQLDAEPLYPAVLHPVVQRFL